REPRRRHGYHQLHPPGFFPAHLYARRDQRQRRLIAMTAGASAAKLGIIAGGGVLPGLLVTACRDSGRAHYLLGLTGFAEEKRLPRPVDSWIRLGEVGKGFDALRGAGVREVVMAGTVERPAIAQLRPDLKGAAFIAKIAGRSLGDDGLLSAVIAEI